MIDSSRGVLLLGWGELGEGRLEGGCGGAWVLRGGEGEVDGDVAYFSRPARFSWGGAECRRWRVRDAVFIGGAGEMQIEGTCGGNGQRETSTSFS